MLPMEFRQRNGRDKIAQLHKRGFGAAASYAAHLSERLWIHFLPHTMADMSDSEPEKRPSSTKRSNSSYRKHIRLRDYDYRENGYYFVTLCTKGRNPLFETEASKGLVLQKVQQISEWYAGVTVDEIAVMPNHLHIIFIFSSSGKSLGQVIQALKSWVTRAWGLGYSIWQSNYYEHVIRHEQALDKIREYIVNNPLVEEIDCEQFYK